ncbi:MAG TPA: glutamate synthase-related protein [Candidatus Brocadiia bacterium]|nr:glutamate synthase-related protein [Candidatus Brocadiia bacterium]
MPEKFHIHTAPVPPRHRPVGKLGIVDWREDCSNCHNCVKRSCVYGLFRDEADALREEVGYLDYIYQCKGCLSCIQNCTKGILNRVVNPEFKRLGDGHYTPDIILSTWFQAETGRIPVSGAGYGGPFSGPGFDAIWTDMSEIVRPTRDGIHGREYINTGVCIGRRLQRLSFEGARLTTVSPPVLESPMPVMFDVIPEQFRRGVIPQSITRAAADIGLPAVVPASLLNDDYPASGSIVPWINNAAEADRFPEARMAMISDGPDVLAARDAMKQKSPDRVISVRMEASPDAAVRIIQLVGEGVEVIHLVFTNHGLEHAASNPRHMRHVLREVHCALVKSRQRDEVTLTASGGIAAAEHVTKALLCGADAVAVDIPLLLALECRYCGECARREQCPIEMEKVDGNYATQRVKNLMGAWHQQLLEMMGAMGIREARRLRGEVGRCMFFEDLERDTFGRIFGRRKQQAGVL